MPFSGIVRSIGVSNFMRGDLKELLENSRIKPVVNQLEINPFNLMEEVMTSATTITL